MTVTNTNSDYISNPVRKTTHRAIPEEYRNEYEAYIEYVDHSDLSHLGKVERISMAKLVLSIMYERFGKVDLKDVTRDMVAVVNEALSGHSAPRRRKSINVLCDIVRFNGGEYHYREFYTETSKPDWTKGHLGENVFQNEIETFRTMLIQKGLSPKTVYAYILKITNVCRVLTRERGITDIGQIDKGCIHYIASLMSGYSKSEVESIRSIIYIFVKDLTGRDLKKEFRGNRTLEQLPDCDETRTFIRELERTANILKRRGCSETTIVKSTYAAILCYLQIIQIHGPMYTSDIGCEEFWDARDSMDLKDVTAANYLSSLGRLIEYNHGFNPYLEANIVWSQGDIVRTYIDTDDWKVLLSEADEQQRIILVLAGCLGLRRGEISRLKLSNISYKVLKLRGKGAGRNGKTSIINLDDAVWAEIQNYLAFRSRLVENHEDCSDGSFLVRVRYNRLYAQDIYTVRYSLAKLREDTGISFSCHTLRRFFCTELIENGEELLTVKALMRHNSIEMMNRYFKENETKKLAAHQKHSARLLT